MKAAVVPFSCVVALGLRLDCAPYMDAAFETPESLRPAIRKRARSAYFREARRGLARIRNLKRWYGEMGLDKVEKLS